MGKNHKNINKQLFQKVTERNIQCKEKVIETLNHKREIPPTIPNNQTVREINIRTKLVGTKQMNEKLLKVEESKNWQR